MVDARTGVKKDNRREQRSSPVAPGKASDKQTIVGTAESTANKSEGDEPPVRETAEPDAWSQRLEGDAFEDNSPATSSFSRTPDASRTTNNQIAERPRNAINPIRSKVIGDAKAGSRSAVEQQARDGNASSPARRSVPRPLDGTAQTPVVQPDDVPPLTASVIAAGKAEQAAKPVGVTPSTAPVPAPDDVASSLLRDARLPRSATVALLPQVEPHPVSAGGKSAADATSTSLTIPTDGSERRPPPLLTPYADAPRPKRESLPGNSQMLRDARLDQSTEDTRVLELAAFRAQVAASAVAILRHATASGF